MASLAFSLLGNSFGGEGLEIGSGFGYLLFPMAVLFRGVRWSAIEHPDRSHLCGETYRKAFRDYNCELFELDLIREPLPFGDARFSVVTFSEVVEHLPPERLNFVLSQIARTIRPAGFLLVSSPNQASLENRLRLLKGKSILDMPDELSYAKGNFGHIRLYTLSEMQSAMEKLGFSLERSVIESNNAGYRGTSSRSWARRIYRMYERAEQNLGILRRMGDTWYMAFRKNTGRQVASQ